MKRIVAIDPGTAGLGLLTAESDGMAHRVLDIEVFASASRAGKYSYAQHDERIRRTRELNVWLRPRLFPQDGERPAVLAVESMSFPPDYHAVAMMCLAWGVITSLLEEQRFHNAVAPELVEAHPSQWRSFLIGPPQIGKRKPTEATMKRLVIDRESEAQLEALRRFPEAIDLVDRVSPELRLHGLDALGVFAWAVGTPDVRRLLSIGRVNG